MTQNITYLVAGLSIYFLLLIYCSYKSHRKVKNYKDYIIAGNRLSSFLFIFILTSTSLSGSIFLMKPAIFFRDGFPAVYTSFICIIIPLTGILFFKKQWFILKKFNFYTQSDMFYKYFKSSLTKYLIIFIGIFFSIPFFGIQLMASGKIISYITNEFFDQDLISIFIGLIIFIYISIGGIRSIAYGDILNTFLIFLGLSFLGFFILNLIGGFDIFLDNLFKLANAEGTRWGNSPYKNYSALFSVPDIIQLNKGIPKETPVGGLWTVSMIFTYILSFMGIQASPAFTTIVASKQTNKGFAIPQIISISIIFGFILFFSIVFISFGSHFLGANEIINNLNSNLTTLLPEYISKGKEGSLVIDLINLSQRYSLTLFCILAISCVAATQASGAIFLFSGSLMIVKDVMRLDFEKNSVKKTKQIIKLTSLIMLLITIILIVFFKDTMFIIGRLSIGFSFQIIIPLFAICYFPKISKLGVNLGLIAGLIIFIFTDRTGQIFFGEFVVWGSWPFTIYSAFWGFLANFLVTLFFSLIFNDKKEYLERLKFHKSVENLNSNFIDKKKLIFPLSALFFWLLISIGPLLLLGNEIFGKPDDLKTWLFGIPSIWAWQIMSWVVGIITLIYFSYSLNKIFFNND